MALGLNLEHNTGPSVPVLKYNAKAGRIARVDRKDGTNTEVDITRECKMVLDWENLETGYIKFPSGAAPEFVLTKYGTGMPAKPTDDGFRGGMRLMVKLHKDCAAGQEMVREVAITAVAALKGFDKAQDEYLEGVKANPGKLPVVVLDSVLPDVVESKNGKTTNYIPVWKTVAWVDRPSDLTYQPRTPNVQPAGAAGGGGTSTGSTQVAPPAPAQQQAAPTAPPSDNDFG